METTTPTQDSTRHGVSSAAETELPVIREHIVRTPGTCLGKPRIAGTRIKVEQVVLWHERQGITPAQIVSTWPHLTLADIHAALAYYHDHRDEIEADLAEGDRLDDELRASQPSILEKIRLRKSDAPDNTLPP